MSRPRGLVYGVGINDINWNVNHKGIHCEFYDRWKNMLERVYSEKFQSNSPTYIGCTVSKEWLTASNFIEWMEKQDYENKQLDKDVIVIGNKHYSADTCCFIDASLNNFFSTTRNNSGLLAGVHEVPSGNYQTKINFDGATMRLGTFKNEIDAHNAYRLKKAELARLMANKETNKKIYDGIIRHAERFEDLSCTI